MQGLLLFSSLSSQVLFSLYKLKNGAFPWNEGKSFDYDLIEMAKLWLSVFEQLFEVSVAFPPKLVGCSSQYQKFNEF